MFCDCKEGVVVRWCCDCKEGVVVRWCCDCKEGVVVRRCCEDVVYNCVSATVWGGACVRRMGW